MESQDAELKLMVVSCDGRVTGGPANREPAAPSVGVVRLFESVRVVGLKVCFSTPAG